MERLISYIRRRHRKPPSFSLAEDIDHAVRMTYESGPVEIFVRDSLPKPLQRDIPLFIDNGQSSEDQKEE